MLEEERHGFIEEACGVFGVLGHPHAARIAFFGLHALQHRGQESAGIVSRQDGVLHVQRRQGLVSEGFTDEVLASLPGTSAIGHVRYSTTGESSIRNAQPLMVSTRFGPLALAHNGNLTNAAALRSGLERAGAIFGTTTDTEVIAHLVAKSEASNLVDAVVDALKQVRGAFSLVAMTAEHLIAVRDAYGVRPLSLARLGGFPVLASEPASFAIVDAVFERELGAGEMFVHEVGGAERWLLPFERVKPRPCMFELVYFARPDSTIFGRDVYSARKAMGAILAEEHPVDADLVIAVPDSGTPAALGFAAQAGLPFEMGLVRSHYVGRTFIEPTSNIRNAGVKLKLGPVASILANRRVVVVDDSIVRGTTSRKIIKMVREAGAREVHFRVASPPTTHPCFYGINTPERSQLIAAHHEHAQIRDFIGADSLGYLSRQGLRRAVGTGPDGFCEACFSGDYPIEVDGSGR